MGIQRKSAKGKDESVASQAAASSRESSSGAARASSPATIPAFEFDRFIPSLIAKVDFRLGMIADEQSRRLGLTRPRVRLLLILQEPDKHRVSRLAERVGMRVSIVSRLLYAMERHGLVRHVRPGGGDARAVTVELTEAGRDLAVRCAAEVQRFDSLLAAGFGAEERRVLAGLLRRLIDNVPLLEAEYDMKPRQRGKR